DEELHGPSTGASGRPQRGILTRPVALVLAVAGRRRRGAGDPGSGDVVPRRLATRSVLGPRRRRPGRQGRARCPRRRRASTDTGTGAATARLGAGRVCGSRAGGTG